MFRMKIYIVIIYITYIEILYNYSLAKKICIILASISFLLKRFLNSFLYCSDHSDRNIIALQRAIHEYLELYPFLDLRAV